MKEQAIQLSAARDAAGPERLIETSLTNVPFVIVAIVFVAFIFLALLSAGTLFGAHQLIIEYWKQAGFVVTVPKLMVKLTPALLDKRIGLAAGVVRVVLQVTFN